MKVSDVMTPECDVCRGSDSIVTVAKLMALKDIGFVPIAEGDKMIGAVTDRDIVVRGLAGGKDVASAPVAELMSDDIFYCYDDQDCSEIAANMAEADPCEGRARETLRATQRRGNGHPC